MDSKEIKEKIVKAMLESKYKWRTARGISKETDISIDQVYDFLFHSDLIIKAKKANRYGKALFALRKKYDRESSFGLKVLNALTNKIH
ncbi:hypothetical protein ABV409_11940 [Flagellimonas sp. DF-77]|uniref:hypothetical protein n=1 Tax=Flagellimonas algarum TaxID=3230298 RepID=UPI003394034C